MLHMTIEGNPTCQQDTAVAAPLVEIAMRDSTEDTRDNSRTDKRTDHRLYEDSILDLAQRRLLNPRLAIKDLPHHIPLLVLCDPRLVLVAVRLPARECLEADFLELLLGVAWVALILEHFPGTEVAVVQAV